MTEKRAEIELHRIVCSSWNLCGVICMPAGRVSPQVSCPFHKHNVDQFARHKPKADAVRPSCGYKAEEDDEYDSLLHDTCFQLHDSFQW